MNLLIRALLSAAVGVIAALAGLAYFDQPVVSNCGGGEFGFSNTYTNESVPSEYGGFVGESWNPGSSIAFSWTSTGNGSATLTVLNPGNQSIYSETGVSGTGSFIATSGTYNFAVPPPPPLESVSVNYQCSTTS